MIKNKIITTLVTLILSIIMLSVTLPNQIQKTKTVQAKVEAVATTTATTTTEKKEESTSQEDEPAPSNEEPPDLRAYAIAVKNAIAKLESHGTGDCTQSIGLSGERGCFQYLHSTWVAYSTEVFGYVEKQTFENTEYVTEEKIYRWLKAGYSARQIFLIWNQGNPGPCKAGVNSHGVPYDSCAYADRGVALLAN